MGISSASKRTAGAADAGEVCAVADERDALPAPGHPFASVSDFDFFSVRGGIEVKPSLLAGIVCVNGLDARLPHSGAVRVFLLFAYGFVRLALLMRAGDGRLRRCKACTGFSAEGAKASSACADAEPGAKSSATCGVGVAWCDAAEAMGAAGAYCGIVKRGGIAFFVCGHIGIIIRNHVVFPGRRR